MACEASNMGLAGTTGALFLICAALAGCDQSGATAGSVPASVLTVQVSSTNCQTIGVRNGKRVDTADCVYVLSDGSRFRCPMASSRSVQSVYSLEHAKACIRLTPIAIPPSWKPVFAAIEKARSCLARRGLRVTGGPSLGAPRHSPETPIGELVVINGNAPVLIGFYENSRVARQFEPTAIKNVKRVGGQLARHGAEIVIWSRPPKVPLRDATALCAFG
jgi:hypothetical protein